MAEEDERSADWIHLLPVRPTRPLVVGCGWGASASALAAGQVHVVAVDVSAERLAFVAVRAAQDRLQIRCVQAVLPWDLPVDGGFDHVAYVDPLWPGGSHPARTARNAARMLRPGGTIAWRADNVSGVTRGNRRGPSTRLGAMTSALQRNGFTDLRVYAPLPDRGITLFHIPLGNPGATRYFLGSILPLIATARPETRRRYGLAARLAALAPSVARMPGVARLAQLLVPGWLVIGRYGEARAH